MKLFFAKGACRTIGFANKTYTKILILNHFICLLFFQRVLRCLKKAFILSTDFEEMLSLELKVVLALP